MHESRSRQRSRSPNFNRHIESQIVRDVYDSEPILDTTPNSTIRRSYNYSSTSKKTVPSFNTDIIEVESNALPPELKDVPLSNDLLPGPGTKVTTTVSPTWLNIRPITSNNIRYSSLPQIKTFTYEIPDDTNVPTNKNFTYKNEFYNTLNSTTSTNSVYPERDVPTPQRLSAGRSPGPNQTYIYKNESHNTINRTDGGYRPPSVGPVYSEPGTNQTYIYKREINETKNNVYGSPTVPPPRSLSPQLRPISPVNSTTVFYERNDNNTINRNVYHPPGGIPVYPQNGTLPGPGPKQTYLYKKETSNTTNTTYGPPPGSEYPPRDRVVPLTSSPYTSSPVEPTTNIYKYTSETTTRNLHEREPLVGRSPFPDHQEPSQVDGASPKHLGQLLATFDDVSISIIHLFKTVTPMGAPFVSFCRKTSRKITSHTCHGRRWTRHWQPTKISRSSSQRRRRKTLPVRQSTIHPARNCLPKAKPKLRGVPRWVSDPISSPWIAIDRLRPFP